jgi:MFS family permease
MRALIAACAWMAAGANAGLALEARGPASAIALRFATGFFLAGVYPPGMKLMASWFRRGRGLALGALIGALTLGKATPYLVNAVGSERWRSNVLAVSAMSCAGGAIMLLFVGDGPHATPAERFDAAQIAKVFGNRGVRLADFGYFGHMWELYAMWTWVPAFLRASFAARGEAPALAEVASFVVIGSGVVGCVLAGLLADRVGRTVVASAAMVVSGACCLVFGSLFAAPPAMLLLVAAIWGRPSSRTGAVLRVRHGAVRSAVHGHGAHGPVRRVPPDDGLDRARRAAVRVGRLGLGVPAALAPGTRVRRRRDA